METITNLTILNKFFNNASFVDDYYTVKDNGLVFDIIFVENEMFEVLEMVYDSDLGNYVEYANLGVHDLASAINTIKQYAAKNGDE